MQKKLVDKLVGECSRKFIEESIDGNEMIYNGTVNDHGNVCDFCTVYIVLFVIANLIIIGISSAYFYFHWSLKKDVIINIGANTGILVS